MRAGEVELLLGPEPGWRRAEDFFQPWTEASFVSGPDRGDRIVVRYFLDHSGAEVRAKVWFGPGAEGPPGHVHGGAMAAVLDEAMGAVGWLNGHSAVVRRLETEFLAMVELRSVCRLEAQVEGRQGRRVRASGRLLTRQGRLVARGRALLVVLPRDRFGDFRPRLAPA